MRIDAFNKVSKLYQTNNIKSTKSVKGSSFSDKLEISQTGKDYQIAKNALKSVPDVREERVREIKERIASGTYNVNAEEVADKLIENYFNEWA
ncbi:MAG TPA: flagellar biosynthesis anti-sigma factor FlgM [Lachnospiraceae bacterium]|mgnify:CR=1 FL=1|jgi:negative regulator of flagellin synthesis FlgM|nr:flagellar biosynthesis anti-sigma factor FlgM [Lachnospiraceae bacterium]